MRSGPLLIGFDGTPAAERAIREAAELLAPRPAVVVVVVQPGQAAAAVLVPLLAASIPATTLEIRTAERLEESATDLAKRLAEKGAVIAREAGFEAAGLAIAGDGSVADILLRVAEERDAQAIALGAHNHGALSELLLGSTTRDVLKRADRPVLVVRGEDETKGD